MTFANIKTEAATPHTMHPVVFSEFFDMGLDEAVSPFITTTSRRWGINLPLKGAFLSTGLLILSFILSFYPALMPFSYIALMGVYFFAGIPFLIESIEDILNLDINIDVLMSLAAFSSVMIGSGMEGGLLLVLFAISGAMEEAVTGKAKSAISSLNKMSPTTALVLNDDGTLHERSVKDIKIGAKILVRAGQLVPLDGKVIEGTSSINMVHLTGENLPVTKKPGDTVPSGGRNLEGVLLLEVTLTSNDSTLSKIIALVTQAQEARPMLQRWFDKLSNTYALTIIGAAFVLSLSMPYFLNIPFLGMEGSLYRSLAFLIAASPCALIIALPIAYLSAISACANKGILLKGGITLDALASCTAIAFDKTGTLTTGLLKCTQIEPLTSGDVNQALRTAFAMERNAVHPIAQALNRYAEEQKISPQPLLSFKSIPGYGLEATINQNGKEVSAAIGHIEFLSSKIDPKSAELLQERAKKAQAAGQLVAALSIDTDIFLFHFEDTPRPHIKEVLHALKKKLNLQLLMLTGDHEDNARKIAQEMDLDEYYANLRPEDKLHYVTQLSKEKGLAMVGDGINDAPALARATVGICMGKIGSTAAIDAADVVLLNDNIELLEWLLQKSTQTRRIVKQNLSLATIAILFASIPALAGLVPLWVAVVLHEGGTVLVGLNGLRLLRK